jgi:inosine-uridine nucleoside N-ribohydrolase
MLGHRAGTRQPGLLRGARVCLMGGSIHRLPPGWPAWDFRDDYNIQIDPAAAQHVLDTTVAATLVPIEVTAQTALRRAHLPTLANADPLGALIAHQAEAFAAEARNDERFGRCCPCVAPDIINFQHDPLACAVALGWDGARIETMPLRVTREADWLRLRVHSRGRPRRVVTAVDGQRFDALWLKTVAGHCESGRVRE